LDWLKTTPIVSLLLAVAFVAAPTMIDPARNWGIRYDRAIDEARDLLVRNPRLAIDADGERLLGPEWVAELRTAAEESHAGEEIEMPARMVARSQGQLDGLLAQAYEARRLAEPAWRLGVLDGATPARNYWAHAFVDGNSIPLMLMLAVLLVVAAPLERSWGSLLFALFVAISIPVSAQGYRLLDASSGIPWSGSSGLAAALVGAYFIRGLGGQFVVPSFVVLPVWLAIEAFVVRGFWLDDLGSVPWATLAGAIGIGAAQSALLRLFGVEAKLDAHAAKRGRNGPNPVVVRAARLRSDGDPHQAFELIQAAWRENRSDEEIAEVFYSIAVELGQPEAAAEAILPVLRGALKKGQLDRALGYWLPLASRRCAVRLEPTAAVRLGEALLDHGHPDEALFSLRSALDAGASTAHALRILNVARDLDPGLTRRAAGIALTDSSLDATVRAKLEPLAATAEAEPPVAIAPRAEGPRAIGATRLDRSVEAEHHAIERTQFPMEPTDTPLESQSLLGGALSQESLAQEADGDATAPDLAGAAPSDVLSHWNDRGALSAGALAGADAEGPIAGPGDGMPGAQADAIGSDLFGDEDIDLLETDFDATDSDQTPLLDDVADIGDEHTSPMDGAAGALRAADPDGEATVMIPSAAALASAAPAAPSAAPPATPTVTPSLASSPPAPAPRPEKNLLRALRAIDAVPLEVRADSIEIDTDGRGKSRLPMTRIEAIAMAAVRGLGPQPVVVVDCVLNWRDDIASPLKLIRFRSDRFEPSAVGVGDPGASPVAALARWVEKLHRASGAACLPSPAILGGGQPAFASLEDYEREVLGAERELGG